MPDDPSLPTPLGPVDLSPLLNGAPGDSSSKADMLMATLNLTEMFDRYAFSTDRYARAKAANDLTLTVINVTLLDFIESQTPSSTNPTPMDLLVRAILVAVKLTDPKVTDPKLTVIE